MKKNIIIVGSVFLVIVIVLVYYKFGKILQFERKYIEIQRVQSPNGELDAVIVESDTGATTSLYYEVYIVKKGVSVTKKDKPVFSADLLESASLIWNDNLDLIVKYGKMVIYKNGKKVIFDHDHADIDR